MINYLAVFLPLITRSSLQVPLAESLLKYLSSVVGVTIALPFTLTFQAELHLFRLRETDAFSFASPRFF